MKDTIWQCPLPPPTMARLTMNEVLLWLIVVEQVILVGLILKQVLK